MCTAVCILQRREGELQPGLVQNCRSSSLRRMQGPTTNCQPRACSERCNDSVCCASLCTFRSAAPKMRIKTFAGNIEQGRPLPMILDPQKTRGISVMSVSEAGCCTIADVPHSLADDFEVLLDLEPSPCQHRPHRPSLARGSAPTPSPITCPVHSPGS